MESPHYKILVVDDEEPMRKVIVSLLSTKGHPCVTASNGLEALDKIMEAKYDALITDIVMPEMDGLALTKELSKHYQSLPVMIMTGHTDEYSAENIFWVPKEARWSYLLANAKSPRIGILLDDIRRLHAMSHQVDHQRHRDTHTPNAGLTGHDLRIERNPV